MRFVLPLTLATLVAGCDADGRAVGYSGPADYAYTLRVACYCVYTGPTRVTVREGEVARAEALADLGGTPQSTVDAVAQTLAELSAIAARAEREADHVTVQVDPTYGFPTELSIDWTAAAADDEVTYTATDYVAF